LPVEPIGLVTKSAEIILAAILGLLLLRRRQSA
jgi:hypothetical protein